MAYISGLASGIDTEALIKQMLEIERRPAALLQEERNTLQQKHDAYRDVNTRLNNLVARLNDLVLSTSFSSKSASSTNKSVAAVTAATSAETATYDIAVSQLAQAQRIASDAVADPAASLGLEGTFQVNGASVEVTSAMSLSDIAAAINAADAGVRATLLSGRLVLTSEETGLANAIELADSGDPLVIDAQSQDEAVVSVVAGNAAQAGTYSVSVTQLAVAQQVKGSDQGSSAGSLGLSGSFRLNGVLIEVGAGDTLAGIRDKINEAGAGVEASISADHELILTSAVTGTIGVIAASEESGTVLQQLGLLDGGGAFVNETVSAQDALFSIDGNAYIRHGNVVDDIIEGLSLALQGPGGTTVTVTRTGGGGVLADLGLLDGNGSIKNELQAAQDALFSIDGIDFASDSNRVTGAVDGLTIELGAVGSATVTVSRNIDHAVQMVQAFVNQYNSTQSFLTEKTAKGALLQGDATILRLAATIQMYASDRVGAPGELLYDSLSVVGITIDRYGVMSLDPAKLRDALSGRPEEVEKLFNAKESVDGFDGIAVRLRDYLESYTKSGTGVISTRQRLFEEQMDSIKESIERLEKRLQLREQALIRRFTEMEMALSSLQGLGVTLSGYINQLTGFRKSD